MCIFAVFSFHNNGYRRYDVIRRCEQVKGVTNVKISDTYGSNAGNIYGCKVGGIYGSKVVREREGLQEVRVEGKFLLKKLKSSLGSKVGDVQLKEYSVGEKTQKQGGQQSCVGMAKIPTGTGPCQVPDPNRGRFRG
ncbi:unnamed protein product [Prunus armeniaca]